MIAVPAVRKAIRRTVLRTASDFRIAIDAFREGKPPV
jgi:hypothetical protein